MAVTKPPGSLLRASRLKLVDIRPYFLDILSGIISGIFQVSFPNESLLAEHAREVHSDFSAEAPNSSQYVCKWCRRRFVEIKGLTKHEALCKVVKANNDTSPRRKRRAPSDEEDNCFVNGETNSIPKASMSSKFVPPQGLNEVLPQMPEISGKVSLSHYSDYVGDSII